MSLTEEVEVLRNIPLFAKVEPAKLKLMAFTSERLEYLSGDELFHEGDYRRTGSADRRGLETPRACPERRGPEDDRVMGLGTNRN
jgi:hypothetical protein